LSLATQELDLVVEGEANKVTDPSTVEAMAARWRGVGRFEWTRPAWL